jgi:hypothetical protein
MLNIDRLWIAIAGFLPILATVATLAPLAGFAHTGIGLVVLGVAVSLSQRRRAGAAHHRAATLLGIAAATLGVGLLGAAFALSLAAGDAIFLAVLLGSRLIGRFGPRWAALGRAMLLPLTALFLAPPVRVAHNPLLSLAGAAVAGLVASGWSAVIPAILPVPGPSLGRVRRAVRAALRARPPRADLHEAALALDAKLAGDLAARRALAGLEYTVDSYRDGSATGAEVDAALDRLSGAVGELGRVRGDGSAGDGSAGDVDGVADAVTGAEAPSASGRTRLALQSTVAVALAFLVGQTIFPDHWPWTVITVMTVSLAARSRGDVLLRSVQRLGGAALATVAATPAATALAGQRPLTVAVILVILGVGLYLRERAYIWWAVAITSVLAFLYGLLGQTGGADLLRERLLAIGLGAACAIVPALVFAPRSVDVVRRRTATCLRRLREALDAPSVAALRRWDTAVVDLRTATAPLLLVRPVRPGPEAGWVDALTACGAPLRTLVVQPDPAVVRQLRRVLGDVASEVRATRRSA